jgi:DNA-binding response OmpR family regulator
VVAVESPRKTVLVVDDEKQILEVLAAYLEREGFTPTLCATAAEAMAAYHAQRPDLMILDITLPDGSGLDILRAAAAEGERIPTIMLTARAEEVDRVVGLELGADDYVTKPFSPREIVARVRAVLRRFDEARRDGQHRHAGGGHTRIGDLEIDFRAHEVRVAGRPTNLTPSEFRILGVLAENPGQVFTRAHLLEVLEDDGSIYERTLDRHINNLRKKIEPDTQNPNYVLTVYGVGYKMRARS